MKRNKFYIVVAAVLFACSSVLKAQTVKSPDGNVVLTFALKEGGVPTYELRYKDKAVIKPSRLGLELARDKHASKGMEETDLMDGFVETAHNMYGAKRPPFATIITSWKWLSISQAVSATSRFASGSTTTVWAFATSFHNNANSTTLS